MGSIQTDFIDPFKPVLLQHPRAKVVANVIPLGLNITRLIYKDSSGQDNDVIAGPEDEHAHWTKGRTFFGPIIGRYANRIPAGPLAYPDGQLDVDEFSAPGVSLHGGPSLQVQLPMVQQGSMEPQHGPFDRLVWSQLSLGQSQFFNDESFATAPQGSSAIFGVISAGVAVGQKGYPGTIRVEVRMAIEPGENEWQPAVPSEEGHVAVPLPHLGTSAGCFNMEYRAEFVEGDPCPATPLNLTHHWGFNLSASDAASHAIDQGTIDNHTLRIFPPPTQDSSNGELLDTTRYRLHTPVLDHAAVPTGKLLKIKPGDEHDWLHPGTEGFGRTLMHKDGLVECYDNFYAWGAPEVVVDEASSTFASRPLVFKMPRVVLRSPQTKLSLAFRSNQSGVQIYAATLQPEAPASAKLTGAKKRIHAANQDDEHTGISKRSYVALEFGHPHATLLHRSYQGLAGHDTILRKGQQYRNWVEIEVYKGL